MKLTEQGFLLLTSHLGNPDRRPLTPPQLRLLTKRMSQASPPRDDSELEPRHLIALGLDWELSERIVTLLGETELLEWYLHRARRLGCVPITRSGPRYPGHLRPRPLHLSGVQPQGLLPGGYTRGAEGKARPWVPTHGDLGAPPPQPASCLVPSSVPLPGITVPCRHPLPPSGSCSPPFPHSSNIQMVSDPQDR